MRTEEEIKKQQSEYYESGLFREFPTPLYEEWRNAAEKLLKGAAFEDKLVTKTDEEITLQPMYRQEDIENLAHISSLPGFFPYVRGAQEAEGFAQMWDICQEILNSTPKEFNEAAQKDLGRGQTMLHIVVDHIGCSGLDPDEADINMISRDGLSIFCSKDMEQALDGISLEQIPIMVQAGSMVFPLLSFVIAHMRKKGENTNKLRGCIGMDPLGILVREGTLPYSLETAYDIMAKITKWVKENTPKLQTILVNSHPYHEGGGNAVHELAFALATGVQYLRELQERGLSIDDIAPRLCFSFSIGSNFFMEIAKFRAARMLWAQIVSAFGGDKHAEKMSIHARTSAWTKTKFDPYVNMLRCTAEAFAGILGGVNSLHVSSFDEAIRPADEFSRRIARNTQLILAKEAHLSKVVDPAGGSWYIEWLTDSLAQKAWALFQKIESQKGMYQALQNGFPQSKIAEMAKKRAAKVNKRIDKIVGVNMYANLRETPLTVEQTDQVLLQQQRISEFHAHCNAFNKGQKNASLDRLADARITNSEQIFEIGIEAAQSGATLGDIKKILCKEVKDLPFVDVIPFQRKAERFEALREQAEMFKERMGFLPKVFLANIGPISQHKTRADFAVGFFEVGGFEVVMNNEFHSVEAAAQEAIHSEASIVVICAKDETYPEHVPLVAQLVKEARADITVMIAGRPSAEQMEEYKQAGVDGYIHIQTDCYETLLNLQKKKGIGR